MEKALKGSCIIGQSGGPTSVINASAYGVIRTALDNENITRVYGAAHGIKGVLEDKLYDMDVEDAEELELLTNTPSSELGSCRYKMADPEADDTDYKRILEIFKKYNVRYFFYNGGNDSMDNCDKISRFMDKSGWECRVIGVPKTIDNDLNNTDHCPGFASAAKYIATSCAEIYKDAHVYDTGMVCIIEIMGRHAGWLTASAALAGLAGCAPDLIYLPETDFDMEKFVESVERFERRHEQPAGDKDPSHSQACRMDAFRILHASGQFGHGRGVVCREVVVVVAAGVDQLPEQVEPARIVQGDAVPQLALQGIDSLLSCLAVEAAVADLFVEQLEEIVRLCPSRSRKNDPGQEQQTDQ